MNKNFIIKELDSEIMSRIKGKSFKADCTIKPEDLRYIKVLHKNLQGETKTGEMICHRAIADDLIAIFHKLYEAAYPIERMKLIDEYNADDEASMSDNNSSAFNFRFISFSNAVSKHGLGMAVDINPLYNPYIKEVNGKMNIEPADGAAYVDRSLAFPYKITTDDLCYKLFIEHGFEWGGSWHGKKDYQHFELPLKTIQQYYPDYTYVSDNY